jgi:hypothetical protein
MENNTVNIKQLPLKEEIIPGNFLIVEDTEGSKILDFKNFVIGPNNTSFYNSLVTNIRAVSTYSTSLCSNIAVNQQQVRSFVDTRFVQLTSSFATINPRWFITYGIAVVGGPDAPSLVDIRGRIGRFTFTSDRDDLSIADANIVPDRSTPSNAAAIFPIGVDLLREELLNSQGQSLGIFNYTLALTTNQVPDLGAVYRIKVTKAYVD